MITHGHIERIRRGLSKWSVRLLPLKLLGGQRTQLVLQILGQGDGAWAIPEKPLESGSVCYCFGIGCDASFEFKLSKTTNHQVHCFDPTPSSIEYMDQIPEKQCAFHPWGIWSEDTFKNFYFQDINDKTNLSLINPGTSRGGEYVSVKLLSLRTIMQKLGHEHVDLVKMDIEGAWFEVLNQIINDGLLPKVLCVEFDSPTSITKVSRIVRRLRRHGLLCIHRERDDYLFVNEELLLGGSTQ